MAPGRTGWGRRGCCRCVTAESSRAIGWRISRGRAGHFRSRDSGMYRGSAGRYSGDGRSTSRCVLSASVCREVGSDGADCGRCGRCSVMWTRSAGSKGWVGRKSGLCPRECRTRLRAGGGSPSTTGERFSSRHGRSRGGTYASAVRGSRMRREGSSLRRYASLTKGAVSTEPIEGSGAIAGRMTLPAREPRTIHAVCVLVLA